MINKIQAQWYIYIAQDTADKRAARDAKTNEIKLKRNCLKTVLKLLPPWNVLAVIANNSRYLLFAHQASGWGGTTSAGFARRLRGWDDVCVTLS